jgi:hypothetical protein
MGAAEMASTFVYATVLSIRLHTSPLLLSGALERQLITVRALSGTDGTHDSPSRTDPTLTYDFSRRKALSPTQSPMASAMEAT